MQNLTSVRRVILSAILTLLPVNLTLIADEPTTAELHAELQQIKKRIAEIEQLLAKKSKLEKVAILPDKVKPEEGDREFAAGNSGMVGTVTVKREKQPIVFHYQHGRVISGTDIPMALMEGKGFEITMHGELKLDKKTKVKIMMAGGGVSHDVNWLYLDDKELGSVGDDRSKHLVREMELEKGTHRIRWLLTAGTFRNNILLIQDDDGKMLPLKIRKEDAPLLKDDSLNQVRITSRYWGWPIPRTWNEKMGLLDPNPAPTAGK